MTTATQTTTTHYAAIGTDGRRPVVWGIGATPDEARADAAEQDGSDADRTVEITADRAARIEAGDVDASDL